MSAYWSSAVWMYGNNVEGNTIYGDFIAKLVWRMPGNLVNQITRQSLCQFYHKIQTISMSIFLS